MKMKRILAWIGIILLAGMYLLNLVLALIGSEGARSMLKISAACTVAVPIILYGFYIAIGGNRRKYEAEIERFRQDPEPDEPGDAPEPEAEAPGDED